MSNDPTTPTYLGDGLYAVFDGFQIELYASDGMRKTNQVYLDSGTTTAFIAYVEQLKSMGVRFP